MGVELPSSPCQPKGWAARECIRAKEGPRRSRLPGHGAGCTLPGVEFSGDARFVLRRLIGAGSFGRVFEAEDRELDQLVALKTLKRVEPEALFRFKQEFRTLARLRHPNLVQLHGLYESEGQWFFTMELLHGVDLHTHLRGEAGFELQRAKAALPQLVSALDELHAAGLLHRDLKPSNIIVEASGRVVVLDFGMVTETESSGETATASPSLGTPAYMAPEQASAQALTPAADWYGVGVILFEALTGRLPFEGAGLAVILRKRIEHAPALDLPEPLQPFGALCTALLHRAPEARASGAQIQKVCGEAKVAEAAPPEVFAGREGILRQLGEAARGAGLRLLHLAGPPGIGKSAILKRFMGAARAEDFTLLGATCHPREEVPFKGVDGLIDRLTRHLLRRDQLAEAICPSQVGALLELFPVMRRVPAFQRAAQPLTSPDLGAGVTALKALLHRLAERARLVLIVEDVHWSDRDSDRLLAHVLADAPDLLLVLTSRDEENLGVAELSTTPVQRIDVGPLSDEESRELLRGLQADPQDYDALAAAAGGHPLLLVELARYGGPDLQSALTRRLAELSPEALSALQRLALLGRPARAALLLGGHAELVQAGLVVQRGGDIGPLREHVAAAALALLSGEQIREAHEALALVLLEEGGAPGEIARHFEAASDRETAVPHLVAAAEAARAAHAYERAVELFRAVQRLAPSRDVRGPLSECLSGAGYALTAARTLGPDPAMDERRVQLYFAAGRLEEGRSHIESVLERAGLPRPAGLPRTVLRLMLDRAALRWARWRAQPKVDPLAAERCEVAWMAAHGFGLPDLLRGFAYQSRAARLALKSGAPRQLARAALGEAGIAATSVGSGARVRRLLAVADAHLEGCADAELKALRELAECWISNYKGDFEASGARAEAALSIISTGLERSIWMRGNAEAFVAEAHLWSGRLARFCTYALPRIVEARLRGDRVAEAAMLFGTYTHPDLILDQASGTEARLREVIAGLEELPALRAAGELSALAVALYNGRPGVHAQLMDLGRRERWNLALHGIPTLRVQFAELCGRAALSEGLLKSALSGPLRRLRRTRLPWAIGLGELLEAQALALTGRPSAGAFAQATQRLAEAGLKAHALVARLRLNEVLDDEAGVQGCLQGLAAAGARSPERFARFLAPIGGRQMPTKA